MENSENSHSQFSLSPFLRSATGEFRPRRLDEESLADSQMPTGGLRSDNGHLAPLEAPDDVSAAMQRPRDPPPQRTVLSNPLDDDDDEEEDDDDDDDEEEEEEGASQSTDPSSLSESNLASQPHAIPQHPELHTPAPHSDSNCAL